MAKFKAKPIVIEAWYFGGGYFAAVDLVRKAGYDESCIRDSYTLEIPFPGYPDCAPLIICKNEWLVRHPNGEIAQYDESEFDLAFEPAGE